MSQELLLGSSEAVESLLYENSLMVPAFFPLSKGRLKEWKSCL